MKIKVLVIFTLFAVLNVGFSVESLAADKAKAERVDKNAKVCKRLEVPGSHIKKRICKPQRYWDKLQQDSQKLSQEMGSRSGWIFEVMFFLL